MNISTVCTVLHVLFFIFGDINSFVYMQLLFNRESFVKTKAAREQVIAGWAPKVNA